MPSYLPSTWEEEEKQAHECLNEVKFYAMDFKSFSLSLSFL